MKNIIKKFAQRGGQKGGFVQIIIVIILALLVMKYYGITITMAIEWFTSFFGSILK